MAESGSSTKEYAQEYVTIFYLMDKRLQEMFIVATSNPIFHAETQSNYKHNDTIKYSISITAAGAISFMFGLVDGFSWVY